MVDSIHLFHVKISIFFHFRPTSRTSLGSSLEDTSIVSSRASCIFYHCPQVSQLLITEPPGLATRLSENIVATSTPVPVFRSQEMVASLLEHTTFPQRRSSDTKQRIQCVSRRDFAILRHSVAERGRDVDAWIALLNFAQCKRFSSDDCAWCKRAINHQLQ